MNIGRQFIRFVHHAVLIIQLLLKWKRLTGIQNI